MINTLLFSVLVLSTTAPTTSAISTRDEDAIEKASRETLLSMPEPPLGFTVSKHPVVVDGKLLGFQVQLLKEDSITKAIIKVELTDRSERATRVAACKGYVNGLATELKASGFKLTDKKLPDIATSDFAEPIVVDMTFEDAASTKVFVKKRMFFTNKGYDITLMSEDLSELQLLADWSTQVHSPAPQVK